MIVGASIGYLLRNKLRIIRFVDPSINIAIYLLLFLLGVSIGTNKLILNNLGTLGIHAFLLTVGGIAGSIALSYLLYKFFFKTAL